MKPNYALTPWQKKQAALLYYFSSMEYLKGLKDRVHALRVLAEGTLYQSSAENRDSALRSARWGIRDTGENWANNAWPFLADFQLSVGRDIADRASQIYHVTGAYQCGRGMDEYSMQWMSPEEQLRFDEMFEELSIYAGNIDDTMDKTGKSSRWKDFGLTLMWQRNADRFPALPKFRVLTEVTAESGQRPPRTGVYVSSDDPNASLQFGWTGCPRGKLQDCATLNELGKAALSAVGRPKLWVDGQAMLDFLLHNLSRPELTSDPYLNEAQDKEMAPSFIACNASTSHPTRWYYVELVSGEYEEIESEIEQDGLGKLRFESGTVCQERGFYFTPAQLASRRRFEQGAIFPDVGSGYGKTIWQLDAKQD